MAMKKSGMVLLAVCFACGMGAGSALAAPSMGDAEAKILNPGQSGQCSHDFVVENKTSEPTEVQLLLGKEEFRKDQIQPNGSKGYNLKQSIAQAKQQGKKVEMDDAATVINLGKNGKLNFYCKD